MRKAQKERLVTIHMGNGSPLLRQSTDRNSKCRCGSGRKTKHCCGIPTKFFHSKPDFQKATNEKEPENEKVHNNQ